VKVRDRASEIKGIFYKIRFIDGSSFNFVERIVNGSIHIYSYEYFRPESGFFFHYQNEGIDTGVIKPLNHLHVGVKKIAGKKLLELLPDELIEHGGPHYMAPKMKLNDFMGMIIVNYFYEFKSANQHAMKHFVEIHPLQRHMNTFTPLQQSI